MAVNPASNLLQLGSRRSMIRYEFPPLQSLDHRDFGGGYNSRDSDINIADTELSNGQNIDISPDKAISKRKGHTLYGSVSGATTGVQGLIIHEPQGGTTELLRGYDTTIERYVAGAWTALTSVTMTTAKQLDSAYFPLTSKTYVVNQTDNVVKYASGASGDQTDASFKKGKYIVQYKNRLLVANVTGQEDYIWYTDLGVDTFSSNNYLRAQGEITGMIVLFDKWLTFTKRKLFVTQNFGFNGTASGPESFLPLNTDFGAIYERTVAKVHNTVFFLGQSAEGIAAVYATDGLSVQEMSDKIRPDLNNLAPAQLTNACASQWGRFYRLSVTPSGQTTNTLEYLYDTLNHRWLPPYTNTLGGFSCYGTVETSGQIDLYAGVQGLGAVYKLNQQDYEETPTEKYTTVGSYDAPVDANPAKRVAQSFSLSAYTVNDTVAITSLWLRMKKNAGTTTGLTVRIETDNNGKPSGTLVSAQATTTIASFTTTSYTYKQAVFTGLSLVGGTTYWLVVQHTTEATGNSQYYWSGDGSSPTYTRGNLANYTSGITSNVDTYTPNKYPTSTSVSGDVARNVTGAAEAFSTLRSGAGNQVFSPTNLIGPVLSVSPSAPDNTYDIFSRTYLLFDTSPLPNDAVITSAKLSVYISFTRNDFNLSYNITSGTPASNTSLTAADYAVADFGSTRFATDINLSSLTVNAYNDFTLNTSGKAAVSLTGITKFAIRFDCDIDNTAPTFVKGGYSSADIATPDLGSNPPRLVVTYTTVTGVTAWTADGTKDQNFIAYAQGAIDGFGDTKAWFLAPQGQKAHIRDIFITAKAPSTSYDIQVGTNTGDYASFDMADIPLSGSGAVWGSTFTWGSSTWGGAVRNEYRLRARSYRARTAKFRFRNSKANQPFTIYGFRTRHAIIQKLK